MVRFPAGDCDETKEQPWSHLACPLDDFELDRLIAERSLELGAGVAAVAC
jgi:hypothetical protein